MIVSPEFIDTAYAITCGLDIGLGRMVLAALYQSLSNTQKFLNSAHPNPFYGPLWVLLGWFWHYFPSLFGTSSRPSRWPQVNAISHQSDPGFWLCSRPANSFLEGFLAFECLLWHILLLTKFKFDMAIVDRALRFYTGPNFKLFWKSELVSGDLILDFSKSGKFHPGFEVYNPHFCAWQFGLAKESPHQLFSRWNIHFHLTLELMGKNYS